MFWYIMALSLFLVGIFVILVVIGAAKLNDQIDPTTKELIEQDKEYKAWLEREGII